MVFLAALVAAAQVPAWKAVAPLNGFWRAVLKASLFGDHRVIVALLICSLPLALARIDTRTNKGRADKFEEQKGK